MKHSDQAQALLLVPTAGEMRGLQAAGSLPLPPERRALVGLGQVAAAARTSALLAHEKPRQVFLAGLGGSFSGAQAPLGEALLGTRVVLHGVGVGEGRAALSCAALGWQQWPGDGDSPAIVDELPLVGVRQEPVEILSVCAASASLEEAARRRARHPAALVEEMEGFGVALACALKGVPLTVVRGISNLAGERRQEQWCVPEALRAVRQKLLELLA